MINYNKKLKNTNFASSQYQCSRRTSTYYHLFLLMKSFNKSIKFFLNFSDFFCREKR